MHNEAKQKATCGHSTARVGGRGRGVLAWKPILALPALRRREKISVSHEGAEAPCRQGARLRRTRRYAAGSATQPAGMDRWPNVTLIFSRRLSRCFKITCAISPSIHPSWMRRSSVTYRRVRALLAPSQLGASIAIVAQVISTQLLIDKSVFFLSKKLKLYTTTL